MAVGSSMNKTYFWAYDDRKGWNLTCFLSFWNDFYREEDHTRYVEFVSLSALGIASLLINLLLMVILCRGKQQKSQQNKYIVGCIVCSLIWLPVVSVIAAARLSYDWSFGDFACRAAMFLTVNTAVVKVTFMAIISAERYLRIARSYTVTNRASSIVQITSVLLVSGTTGLVVVPNSFTQEICYQNMTFNICTVAFEYHETLRLSAIYMVTLTTAYFVVPSIVISVNYLRIMALLKNSVSALNRHRSTSARLSSGSTTSLQRRRTAILLLMVAMFVVMWSVLFGCLAALTLDTVFERFEFSSHLLIMAVCIALLNTIIEPLLYSLTAGDVRQEFKRCFVRPPPAISSTDNT